MAQTRFTCTLTTVDEPACQSYARVTITDGRPGHQRSRLSPTRSRRTKRTDWRICGPG